jgi:heat shock protein HslJ
MFVAVLAATAGCSRTPATSDDTAPAVTTTAPQLEGTYWRLVAIGDTPVPAANTEREAHIILNAASRQATGSGGCNRMFGTYTLNGDALSFSGVGSTKMACPGAMETENAFLPALARVAKWRSSGQQLELLDAAGSVVARFEAKAK